MRYLHWYLQKTFTLDLRALALLRIGIAAVLLVDLYTRATDLEAFYANSGVLPLPALFQNCWNPYFFSFHTTSGLWQIQVLYFLLAAGLAFCLLIGFQTRLVTVLCWVFLVSVQNRNPLITQGGDDLLRMMLFWGIFLPWGRFYAIQTIAFGLPSLTNTKYFSAATVAFVLQICLVYFCTALLKSAPEWRTQGTALYYALSLDQLLLPGGRLLYPHYALLKFMTFGVYYTELILPFLLLIPLYNRFFRFVVIGILVLFHVGISVTLFVGLFYLINLVSVLGLLPASAMNFFERKLLPRARKFCQTVFDFCRHLPYPFSLHASLKISFSRPFIFSLKILRETFVCFLLLYTICWNLNNTPQKLLPFPEGFRWLGYWLRVDQNWGMFAPSVFKDDGWFILEATTLGGQKIDLNRNGKPVNYRKPKAVVKLFKNDRWRKYSENYLFIANDFMRPYYCNYLLRVWNEKNSGQAKINNLAIIYMKEVTLDHYKTEPIKREVLCQCER